MHVLYTRLKASKTKVNKIVKLEVLVPGFDPEKFKPHHAQKVLKWFKEIKEKVIAYVEEGEEEIAAEEAKPKAKKKAVKKTKTKE